jgi:hypothetical protein
MIKDSGDIIVKPVIRKYYRNGPNFLLSIGTPSGKLSPLFFIVRTITRIKKAHIYSEVFLVLCSLALRGIFTGL